MDIGFARLHAFAETAHVGSMTAAAAALGYSVGAVSQQVSALERELGRQLFDRVGRGLRLTDAGAVFLPYAEEILRSQADALAALADPWEGDRAVPVKLGVFGSLAAVALSPAVAALAERAPNVVVQSVELNVDDVAEAVRRASVDMAFGIDYASSPAAVADGVVRTVLATEPFQLAVRDDDPRRDVVDLPTTGDDTWIAAPSDTQFGQAVRAMCRRAGFEPPVMHAVADTGACLAMAAAGLGVTPVTRMMFELRPSGLRLLQLRPVETRDIVLLTSAGRAPSPVRQLLTDVLQATVAPYDQRTGR